MLPGDFGISQITFDFINNPDDNERKRVIKFISTTFDSTLKQVLEAYASREGKPNDSKTIEILMAQHGKDALLLAHRILDELMMKEFKHQPSQ